MAPCQGTHNLATTHAPNARKLPTSARKARKGRKSSAAQLSLIPLSTSSHTGQSGELAGLVDAQCPLPRTSIQVERRRGVLGVQAPFLPDPWDATPHSATPAREHEDEDDERRCRVGFEVLPYTRLRAGHRPYRP